VRVVSKRHILLPPTPILKNVGDSVRGVERVQNRNWVNRNPVVLLLRITRTEFIVVRCVAVVDFRRRGFRVLVADPRETQGGGRTDRFLIFSFLNQRFSLRI